MGVISYICIKASPIRPDKDILEWAKHIAYYYPSFVQPTIKAAMEACVNYYSFQDAEMLLTVVLLVDDKPQWVIKCQDPKQNP